ncbi:metalloprotease, partial [Flavobacteriaceae bacterium]|nr:metalloprotease [Flavobacteriaceae bacterium]
PLSNDYLITANTSMGIWKWVEAYGDIGFIKQDGQSSRILFDSGIRLNLLPDYLEFYFPIYNSNGLEFNQTGYEQKIRFVLTLDPYTLTQLFSRKWF